MYHYGTDNIKDIYHIYIYIYPKLLLLIHSLFLFYFLIVSVGKFNLDCFHLWRRNLNISTCFVTLWISDASLHLFPLLTREKV